eukprot:g4212.t1
MAGLTYRFTFIDVNEETPAFAPRSLTEQLVPCTYFSKGSCRNGDSCSFCHLPHCHTPKLDKRQRMVVAKLCTYDRLSLALVALQLKANRAEKQRAHVHDHQVPQPVPEQDFVQALSARNPGHP